MLPHSAGKVKGWISHNRTDLLTALVIFLIGMASFGLGRLSVSLPQKEPISLEDSASESTSSDSLNTARPAALKNGSFVASKSGSVYYAVWCSGVSRISEANKIWFETQEQAKAQGYHAAKNCPGL